MLGVLLNGLVLKAGHNPDFIKSSFKFVLSTSNSTNSSFLPMSISIDKNLLLSPLLTDAITPPAGEV